MQQPEIETKNAIREELIAFQKSIIEDIEAEVNAVEATKALELAQQVLQQIKRSSHLSE